MSSFVFYWVLLSVWFLSPVCKMNVHIRCRGNVAPNCGVNSVELANKLAEMGLQAGGLSKRNSVVQRLSFTEQVKSVLILLKSGFNKTDLSGVLFICFFTDRPKVQVRWGRPLKGGRVRTLSSRPLDWASQTSRSFKSLARAVLARWESWERMMRNALCNEVINLGEQQGK